MHTLRPWYREPWPWLLMAGPGTVVVAGIVTTIIAVRTSDPLVADDYYKQGLAVNRVLAKERAAEKLGLSASVQVNGDRDQVRVLLPAAPDTLRSPTLSFVHPTRAGEDRSVALTREAPGVWHGTMAPLKGTTYEYHLQDATGQWRLSGRWKTGH